MQRVNYIDEDSDDDVSDDNEGHLVLHIDGNGSKPFLWKVLCAETFLMQ